jgi:hypothetical protein
LFPAQLRGACISQYIEIDPELLMKHLNAKNLSGCMPLQCSRSSPHDHPLHHWMILRRRLPFSERVLKSLADLNREQF